MKVWPGETQVFSENECFLCGTELTSVTRTDEHVFPKWLLHEFDLWNARLELLNGTPIPYRQLKIPCCAACNNVYLSRVEETVKLAYASGYSGFVDLNADILFLWLAKITYGLLVRELFLPADKTDGAAGPIVPAVFLEQFRMHHYLRQAAIGRVAWQRPPASIVLFHTQVGEDRSNNFDFSDGVVGPFLAMRLGPVGILAVLQDWGAFESMEWAPLEQASHIELAPLQFREVMTIGRYWANQFNRTPHYIVSQSDRVARVDCMPFGGLSGKPLWDPFDLEEYGRVLAATIGVSSERVVVEGRIRTWLSDGKGELVELPFDAGFA